MEKGLKEAFQKTRYEDRVLADKIWHEMVLRSEQKNRLKLWAFSSIGFISLAGLVPVWRILSNDIAQSGLYEYFSLIFSGNSILSYWKELAFSIAESLPITSILLSLSLVFVLFISFKYATKQIVKGQLLLST